MASITEKLANNYLVMTNPIENQMHWKMQLPIAGILRVMDLHGKEVFTEQVKPSSEWYTTDVSSWINGVYYASFTTGDGQVIRRKLMKM
jgi:hypothetical protein